MKIDTLEIESPFGVTLPQPFYRADNAGCLMILLPGRGYTVHHPALAYMAYMGVEQGCDVLGIHYGFQFTGSLSGEQFPLLLQDIDRTLAAVDLSDYSRVVIVGKSMGTPLAVDLARRSRCDALILLTPVPQALGGEPPAPTLALIGTADPFYSPQMVQDNPQIRWQVFEGLDHGFLKAGDWAASLSALGEIIRACGEFIST